MGYRSSWYLAIEGDTAKKIKREIILAGSITSLGELLSSAESELDDDVIYFEAHDLKMYGAYPDVAAFYTWLDTLDENDFQYYEVGEDDGDITSRGTNFELLQLCTSVQRY